MHSSPTSTSDKSPPAVAPVLREEDVREASNSRPLLLDLAGVECVTAGGLGELVALHNRVRDSGGRLVLVNVGERAFEVFAAVGLTEFLELRR